MSALATRSDTALMAAPERNAFEAYGESTSGNRIVGDLLKFNKGDWLTGQNGDEVAKGTRLVAAVNELMVGWLRWSDKKVIDMKMGRVADSFMPPARATLGDLDQHEWDVGDDGRPQDPWQLTSYLICKEETGDQLYTYAPSSTGGRNAVSTLTKEYGKRLRQKPDELPVVALEVDSYQHKTYGRTKIPVLKIVGWTDKAATMAAITGEAEDAATEAEDRAADEEVGIPPYAAGKPPKGSTKAGTTRF